MAATARGLGFGLLAACFALPALAADVAAGAKRVQPAARAAKTVKPVAAQPTKHSLFGQERASHDAREVAEWIVEEGDNHAGDGLRLPFVILDKKDARVFVFHPDGKLMGAAPALIGLGRGDTALPGIGARELSAIAPKDRVTQAGRFVSDIGLDSHGEDVLWLDYDGGLAMHRVIATNPKERRLHRLATPTPLDNRISWGCINLPVKFYENVVAPAFAGTKGIVYVLPEHRQARAFFASLDPGQHGRKQITHGKDAKVGAGGS